MRQQQYMAAPLGLPTFAWLLLAAFAVKVVAHGDTDKRRVAITTSGPFQRLLNAVTPEHLRRRREHAWP